MTQELSNVIMVVSRIASLSHKESASETGNHDDALSDDDLETHGSYRLRLGRHSTDLEHAYDLSPPPPTITDRSSELIAERLFSIDHLHVILKDNVYLQRFTTFLVRYRARTVPILVRYLDSQKALRAIEYANALADQITQQPSWPSKVNAASLDPRFEQLSQGASEELVAEALPAYVTFSVVDVVTELPNKEIVGRNTPLMRELVHGLGEVYCMSDPTQEGNPIVFASEEFYNTTQYRSGYAIGKACRFLHGPKTDKRAIERMDKAVREEQEVAETMVQYRQDGSPFLALVMISPLKDNKGVVRYFIGARIDVTRLLEGGKTIDSFQQLLAGDGPVSPTTDPLENRPTLRSLRDFGKLLNDEERISIKDCEAMRTDSRPSTPKLMHSPSTRRFVGIEERISQEGLRSQYSGRTPGVYQNYILVRPYPSLRIVFTSPSLRIPGLCQSKLEDHIGGPEHIRDSLVDALARGIGVTAKISWLTRIPQSSSRLEVPTPDNGASIATNNADTIEGKARWIHCTPLTGSDGEVGVIMIIMVDKQDVANNLSNISNMSSMRSASDELVDPVPSHARARSYNSKGRRSLDHTPERWQPRSGPPSVAMGGTISNPLLRSIGGSRLYAETIKEIRESQKKPEPFSTKPRDNADQYPGLGLTATAVSVQAAQARGRIKKARGTF
ncbi:phosphorelay sensor kinase [Ascochyta rabiei]|uniref:Phosphorelay sensor kinase n=1 Tax=Didymella rabiei TaxID=5454 RepID=A0A163FKM7_DIDRA|nr:phosphorelay sensor kinase [Ascochyta rabiei]